MSDDVTSLSGPVESIDGKLVLQIPLAAGGDRLVEASRGIGTIVEDCLQVSIPDWLAAKLGITEGTVVNVNNIGGKFNIAPQPSD
jgi:hypothetical protein